MMTEKYTYCNLISDPLTDPLRKLLLKSGAKTSGFRAVINLASEVNYLESNSDNFGRNTLIMPISTSFFIQNVTHNDDKISDPDYWINKMNHN
ncbi:MAG: hypothetical protein H0U71_03165 [Gammaproteobacteria bacterium]|nr:hypothetical protein [Gammaproteobacteria bacterium]